MPARGRPALVFLAFFFLLLWTAPPLEFFLTSPDHGYQLALARQIVHGKFPFVDLFFHYGPLTAFTSALGIRLSDSLVSEVLICTAGYAAALFLLHRMARAHLSAWPAACVSLTALLFVSRLYKWYYWLFPLVVLYLFHLYLVVKKRRVATVLSTGLVAGVALLFRFDLGLASLCFFGLALSTERILSKAPPSSVRAASFVFAFVLPLAGWLLVLGAVGGVHAVADYFRATFDGSVGAVQELSLPFPRFDWRAPLSLGSASAALFLVVPVTNLACLLRGLWAWRFGGDSERPGGAFMAATGLMGLGVFPQALHRSDLLHLLQTLPCFLLAAGLLVRWLWRDHRPLAAAYLTASCLIGWGVHEVSGGDQGPVLRNPVAAYLELHRGLESELDHPVIHLMREVRARTKEDDPILVASVIPWSQLYYFADRPASGFLIVMAPGILDGADWRGRNLVAIQREPPALVIARGGFFDLPPTDWLPKYQPEVYDWVQEHYRRVVYDQDGWLILTEGSPTQSSAHP